MINYHFNKIYNSQISKNLKNKLFDVLKFKNIKKISIIIFVKITIKAKNEIMILKFENFKTLNYFFEKNKYLIINRIIINVTTINVNNIKKFFIKINEFLIIKIKLKKLISR